MRKTWFIVLTFILLMFSCDKSSEVDIVPDSSTERYYTLIGEWEWYETSGGYGGDAYYNPEITGNTLYLTFVRNGKLIIVENNDTTFVTDYFVTESGYYESRDILTIECDMVWSQFGKLMLPAQYIFSVTDTLRMYEISWSDGYGHRFKRVIK